MPSIRRVIIFAKDFECMVEFYRSAFALTEVQRSPGFVVLGDGGAHGATEVALHAIPERIAADITIADPPAERSGTPIKPVFFVDSLAAAADRFTHAGGRMRDADTGGEHPYRDGIDPEGNVIQLFTP